MLERVLRSPQSLKYILNLSLFMKAFNGDSGFSALLHFKSILLERSQSKLDSYLIFLAFLSTILYLKVLFSLANSLGIALYSTKIIKD